MDLLSYYITLADLSVGRFACYVIQHPITTVIYTIGLNAGSKQGVYC